jgi:hypothetical protein
VTNVILSLNLEGPRRERSLYWGKEVLSGVDQIDEFVARVLCLAWSAVVTAVGAIADGVRAEFRDLVYLMPLLFACVIKARPLPGGPEKPAEPAGAEIPASDSEPGMSVSQKSAEKVERAALSPSPLLCGERVGVRGESIASTRDVTAYDSPFPSPPPSPHQTGGGGEKGFPPPF